MDFNIKDELQNTLGCQQLISSPNGYSVNSRNRHTLGVTFAGVWLYATLTRGNFYNILYWVLLGEGLLLIFMGIASGLSTSEYVYIRRGAINPTIMRADMKHLRRGPEKRGMGILLGLVGLTIIFIWLTVYSPIRPNN